VIKIGICGHFGGVLEFFDGQTIKTKILFNELADILGSKEVITVDTYNWRKAPFKLLANCIKLIKHSDNIIILPAQNGIKIFVPLFTILNRLYKKKLHYIVIGGWLPEFVGDKKYLLKCLIQFNNIFVETRTMQNNLNLLGLNNVSILPNFKRLRILKEDELILKYSEPYRLCTFSRVTKEKGIEDAINAVIKINEMKKKTVCNLDIYGQIDMEYEQRFQELLRISPDYINYKGIVPFDRSVEVLKNYFLLLFPTRFKTEGIPGSIIDSYFAGVPIIASKWNSFYDVIEEGITGVGFEFGNIDDLVLKLKWGIDNPEEINTMRFACIKKAKEYTPEYVIGVFLKYLE
jgi:glycosyltransferase involved in cell wall biosynthesis